MDYFVLCGKNKKLYQKLKALNCNNIHPLPYIFSKEKMNELYSMADAIITKPGGVTISEALKKGLPIFIHSALPGQEEINLKLLKKLKLVHELNDKESLENQIIGYLRDESLTKKYQDSLMAYLKDLQVGEPADIYRYINSLLESDKAHI